jgi:hypothetical protein
MSALLGYERWGVAWYDPADTPTASDWQIHNVSGPRGIKFDRIVLHDLDGDTDLDAVTTEEKVNGERGLGVVWYENPTLSPELTPGGPKIAQPRFEAVGPRDASRSDQR